MAKSIMFLGTGSDVGKSIAAAAFCRLLKKRGYRVAPFKSQNMSNNSFVTIEGGEIGRAQAAQAEAAGVLPSVHMNPILLKPSSEYGSQVIVRGEVLGQMDTMYYQDYKHRLKKIVRESYEILAGIYDFIVIEGAGSCCEMNLKKYDLVNLPFAKQVGAPCILVADIDKGGVFAQIIGSMHLMTPKEKALIIGFLINKFRGDRSLFDPGVEFIEKKTKRPVFGVIPFFNDIVIDSEDSVVIQGDKRVIKETKDKGINIAVVRLPGISNFTDLEILALEKDVVVNFLFRPEEIKQGYDLIVIPGTKNVMEDSLWIRYSGWKKALVKFIENGGRCLGICGGYQLLGEKIFDPFGIESDKKEAKGLGIIPIYTTLERKKVVRKVTGACLLNGKPISGYEIHMGRSDVTKPSGTPLLKVHKPGSSKSWEDGWSMDGLRILGTYIHGILDSPGFRSAFLNDIRKEKGLREKTAKKGRLTRFHQYDKLAAHFEANCDVDRILSLL